LRFAVQRSGNPVASPRFHGVPRRDVTCRVHVSVTGVPAGHAPEDRLALAAFGGDVPARAATLARVRGWYPFDSSGGFVLKALDQTTPPGLQDPTVQPRFRSNLPPRVLRRAFRRSSHVLDPQILYTDQVKPARHVGRGLLCPVVAPVLRATFQPSDMGLNLAPTIGPELRPSQFPLKGPESRRLKFRQAGAAKKLPSRQGGRHGHAAVKANNSACPRPLDRSWDRSKRNMPTSRPVACYPERLHILGNRTRPSEPNPSCLRHFDCRMVPVEATHIIWTDRYNAEALLPFPPPCGSPVRPGEEVPQSLREVAQGLLLHHLRSITKPQVLRPGSRKLPALLKVPRRRPPTGTPPRLLLHSKVPDVSSVRTMPNQNRFLLRGRLKTIPRHTNTLTNSDDKGTKATAMSHRVARYPLLLSPQGMHFKWGPR
jgi:hypothetical protein